MVSIEQIQKGILTYVKNDMIPKMPGWAKIMVTTYVDLAGTNMANIVRNKLDNPMIKAMGIVDQMGNIDVGKLYEAAVKTLSNGEKYPIPLPIIGDWIVDKSDLDKIYQYIIGG